MKRNPFRLSRHYHCSPGPASRYHTPLPRALGSAELLLQLQIHYLHTFSITIGKEGIRVFQAFHPDYDMKAYSFPQYIARGGARLRSWEEAEEFLKKIEIIETLSVKHYTPVT